MTRIKQIIRRVSATYIGAFLFAPLFMLAFLIIFVCTWITELSKGALDGLQTGAYNAMHELRGGWDVAKRIGNPLSLRRLALKALSDEHREDRK